MLPLIIQILPRFEITKKLKQQQKMQGKLSKGKKGGKAKDGSDDEAEEGQVS